MSSEHFLALWEPRVGPEAARLIQRRAWFAPAGAAVVVLPLLLAVVVSGAAYWVLGALVGASALLTLVWSVRRSNRRLASALSDYLGFPITPKTLPPVRSIERFDEAVSVLRNRSVDAQGRPS